MGAPVPNADLGFNAGAATEGRPYNRSFMPQIATCVGESLPCNIVVKL